MSTDNTILIPPQLAVLPLPYPFVLHPSLLLSIPLSYAHSLSLLKAALQTSAATAGATDSSSGADSSNSSSGNNGDRRPGAVTSADIAANARDRPIVVACLPTVRAPPGAAALPTPSSQQKAVVPFGGSNTTDLAEWGCAARLLRLTRHPASQTCTLLVTGLARVRVDQLVSQRISVATPGPASSGNNSSSSSNASGAGASVQDISVPLATVTVFPEGNVSRPLLTGGSASASLSLSARRPLGHESGDAELIRGLRAAAHDLLDALSALPVFTTAAGGGGGKDGGGGASPLNNTILPVSLVSPTGNGSIGNAGGPGSMPLLPPVMLKRLRALVKDTPDVAAATLADVLVGTLGGACDWASRLSLLSEHDARARVAAATRCLNSGASRVLLAKELSSALSAPLNAGSKEALLRQQLESLLATLVTINPNVSARITTPTGGFSISGAGAASGNKDESGGSGKNGRSIITIRSGGNNANSDAARIINSIRNGNNPFKGGNAGDKGGNPFGGMFGGGGNNASGGNGGGGAPFGNAGAGGDDSAEADEITELSAKLSRAQLTPEARKACEKELKRLQRIPQQSVERGVLITYLELMAELPWERTSADLDQHELALATKRGAHVDPAIDAEAQKRGEGIVERARRILDEDHYGLEKIKKRLVEYLAVLELKTIQAEEQLAAEQHAERQHKALPAPGDDGSNGGGAAALAAQAKQQAATESNINDALHAVFGDAPASSSSSSFGKEDANDVGTEGPLRHVEDLAEEERQRHAQRDQERSKKRKASVADKGPILLLVGPPGTGKTSIAKSLATALGRPFTRLSLGGVRDEAEIRGHRRTYVGAMAGSIVQALRKVSVSDPVILLDEVDKLGSGNGLHGDPMAAMLEVLDPEQNHSFNDHYVNCPIDLSKVLFIATANSLDTISPPLLDRTEVIQVSGYTHDEKVAIARQYLLPKQIKAQGLKPEHLSVSDEVLLKVAMSYTREAGVRTLERQIGAIARAKAVEYAEVKKGAKDADGNFKVYDPVVRVDQLEKLLGVESYDPEVADLQSRPGVATGLAYQGSGAGGILHIESILLPPGNGHLKLTGSLGDVIRESAELALSWVKAHAFQLGIVATRESEFPKNDVHLHLPSGAIPKDGPSAGIAMTCALVSLFTRTPISPTTAMTGEITLRGQVTPVGGIKEKCLGAHRAGIHKVLLPARNRKDIEADLPANVKADLQIVYIKTIWQALDAAFGLALFDHSSGSREGIEEGRRMMEYEQTSRL